jgi:proteasome lid subunit RPN8/RPN11
MDEVSSHRKVQHRSPASSTQRHHLRQPAPFARSIRWQPTADIRPPTSDDGYPIFISQRALAGVHEHLASQPNAGILGFLVGDLFECPESLLRYLVIDAVVRMPQPLVADETPAAVRDGGALARRQLERSGGELLGWYHSHPPLELSLSPADLIAHAQLFPEPWQVALIVGNDQAGFAGGFFRRGPRESWPVACLPFYELLAPSEMLNAGPTRSQVPWRNYRTEAQLASVATPEEPAPIPLKGEGGGGGAARGRIGSRASPPSPASAASPVIFFPDDDDDESDEEDRPRPPNASGSRRWARRALYGLSGLVVAAALVGVYGLVARAKSPVEPPPAVAPSPRAAVPASPAVPSGLDRLSDAVARAVLGYNERARMFAKEQLDCSDLAVGLVAVEESWMAYNTARRDTSAPLAAPLAARDQELTTSVDGVESHFDRSQCERP